MDLTSKCASERMHGCGLTGAAQVVGCSGAVFGFMGLYVADMALNFRSLSFPWLRLIWICATLGYFVVASVTQASQLATKKRQRAQA